MIDIHIIRKDTDRVKHAMKLRKVDVNVDAILDVDKRRRELIGQQEALNQKMNEANDKIAQLKKKKVDAKTIINEMKLVSEQMGQIKPKVEAVDRQLTDLMLLIPNLPYENASSGDKRTENKVISAHKATKRTTVTKYLSHMELCESLGLLDQGRSSKISGSGFALFKGPGARLERALIQFMLDQHTSDGKYTEVSPPYIVKRHCMEGTGQLPIFEEDMYRLKRHGQKMEDAISDSEDMFLIPTAEVPLTNIHRGEILKDEDLPVRYVAYTPCFRLEAGAYGKDTQGITRVHQFDKVELVKMCKPEDAESEHEDLLKDVVSIFQKLELTYRVLLLAANDMGFAAAKCYDVEVWSPGLNRWLEASSCSNFTDFQARRAGIKYRDSKNRKTKYVHTLNASGVALARTFIAVVENYQQPDGSILIPEVLRPYMGNQTHIK